MNHEARLPIALLVLLASCSGAAANGPTDAPDFRATVTHSGRIEVPATFGVNDPCTNEVVVISGTALFDTATVVNASGGSHMRVSSSFRATGIGPSGIVYRLTVVGDRGALCPTAARAGSSI